MDSRSLFWFRRDLRLADNPALLAALEAGEDCLALFVMDLEIAERSGSYRRAYLADSLQALDASLAGKLAVINGRASDVIPDVIREYGITSVHAAKAFTRYGLEDEDALLRAGVEIEFTGSGYAVAPGRVRKSDGTNYRVYTPFFRGWQTHGWRDPAPAPVNPKFVTPLATDRELPDWSSPVGDALQRAGEKAAHAAFEIFIKNGLDQYDQNRNLPGVPGTSRMSPHLRWGEIHPRTLLARLNQSSAHEVFRKEIAWREFYADVLHNYPETDHGYYAPQYQAMRYDEPGAKFDAWREGKTGYPIVDAAMRQLVAEGWMHNRSRMIVASFLVKDLHIEWQHGANHFMNYLIDNDVASNAHGWQWTAGCGTDASPYYRVFNPIEQGKRFDPEGDYIRKFVPELAHLSAPDIHEPWGVLDGYSNGYCERIVDHATERLESLARLAELKVAKELLQEPRA
jgi:deoxyribodipyrimidine photo-lyase